MPPMAFTGVVTKVGCMNKTATVTVSRWVTHARTGKRIERSKKYLTHDEKNQLCMEDTVLIRNCRPISARKRFALDKVLKSPESERAARSPAPTVSTDQWNIQSLRQISSDANVTQATATTLQA